MNTPNPDLLMSRSAEAATLGSMMLNARVIPSVLRVVSGESFALREHRAIFTAIVSAWAAKPQADLDALLVRAKLEEANALEEAGGLEYLHKVVESVPTSANAVYYAEKVADRARYRQVFAAVEKMRTLVLEGGEVGDLVRQVQQAALTLTGGGLDHGLYHVSEHATNVAVATQDEPDLAYTGFTDVDRLLGGISRGDMVIVAARPSIGKTAFAGALALRAAQAGKRVVFFTLEMTASALIERFESVLSRVPLHWVKRRAVDAGAIDRFYEAALALAKLDITIVERCAGADQMAGVLRQCQQIRPVDLVCIDYLGLMRPPAGARTRNDQVSEISRGLKLLAQSERVPLVVLSQLNRECESRDNHRPRLSDLRDSGSLEQDADAVLMLHREDYYRKLKDPESTDLDGIAEVIVTKARNGPTGVARLLFIDNEMRFENLCDEVPL